MAYKTPDYLQTMNINQNVPDALKTFDLETGKPMAGANGRMDPFGIGMLTLMALGLASGIAGTATSAVMADKQMKQNADAMREAERAAREAERIAQDQLNLQKERLEKQDAQNAQNSNNLQDAFDSAFNKEKKPKRREIFAGDVF